MSSQTINSTPYRVPGIKPNSENTMFSNHSHGSVAMAPGLSSQSTGSDKSSGGFSMSSDTTYNSYASPSTPGFHEQGSPIEYPFLTSCDGLPQYPQDPPSPVNSPSHTYVTSYEAKATPKSLGWTTTGYLDLYNFVVEKGKDPYFLLDSKWTETVETPFKVFLDQPKRSQKTAFPCLFPGCTSKQTVFARTADLERHYESVHLPDDQKPKFPCTHKNCGRYTKPFGRKDHCRDHLRDFHKADIRTTKCHKGKKNDPDRPQTQANRPAERRIYATNWICGKCLVKMTVKNHGWNCTKCNVRCEEERIQARLALPQKDSGASTSMANDDIKYEQTEAQVCSAGGCEDCNDNQGWVQQIDGEWVICPNCTLYQAPEWINDELFDSEMQY